MSGSVVRGMRSAEPATRVETFANLDSLPDDAAPLFAAATDFFSTRAWWEIVLAHAIPPSASPLSVAGPPGRRGERRCFPCCMDPAGFRALTTPYTCRYEPLIAPDAIDRAAIFTAFARYLPVVSPRRGWMRWTRRRKRSSRWRATQAGLAVARFDHFGNWHEDVAGLDWQAWLARPSQERCAKRSGAGRGGRNGWPARDFDCSPIATISRPGSRRSKRSTPEAGRTRSRFPPSTPRRFAPPRLWALARVGVWWIGDTPAAAQFWIVEHGRATVLKLAHDEAFKAHSPGTVLTAWMIRHMIEQRAGDGAGFWPRRRPVQARLGRGPAASGPACC